MNEPEEQRLAEEMELPASVPHMTRRRLSDGQAVAALILFLIFRAITQRVGFGFLPRLLASPFPWVLPLLNNTMLILIAVGTEVRGNTGMLIASGIASVAMSLVSGLVLYWAGYRFGPELAVRAEKEGSMWASLWNPKQVARAHAWIERYGFGAVVIGRMVEWLVTPVVLVAGSTRMSIRKFLPAYLIGSVGFAATFLWLGGRAGDRWPWLPDRIKAFGAWSLRITLALLVLMAIAAVLSKKQDGPKDAAPTEGSPPA
ncbi:MAG TPA: VTT domain-containing protein [Actinomycetota bacterium]|nr:VTT domain-containing protein [Actinomycetota bacterium]